MVAVTTVDLIDDMDGNRADESVSFALDGAEYTIDLSKKNAAALRKALAEFVAAARRVDQRPAARRGKSRTPSVRSPKEELDAIRAWARDNNVQVSKRGRISQHVRELYAGR